jgi:hypothetical protein
MFSNSREYPSDIRSIRAAHWRALAMGGELVVVVGVFAGLIVEGIRGEYFGVSDGVVLVAGVGGDGVARPA